MRMIIREEIPCWYELSWQEKEPAILLRIHEDFIKDFKPIASSHSLVRHYMEKFKFNDFTGNLNNSFGFNKALKFTGKKENFSEFLIKIPVVKKKADRTCSICKGSGKNNFLDEECLSCHGSGKEDTYTYQSAFEISASLSMLLSLMRFFEKDTSASFPQLLIVEIVTEAGQHGGSLSGTYSVSLCEWLRSLWPNTELPEVTQAIKTAHDYMLGIEGFDNYSLRAYLNSENGSLIINCPGDACGLHPAGSYIKEGRGYEFSCHNVDTPAQQLTLLTGLAALHDKARKEIDF